MLNSTQKSHNPARGGVMAGAIISAVGAAAC